MSLTPAQLTALKAAILADTDPAVVTARTNGADNEIARLYNLAASPSFTVWKSGVSRNDVGKAFLATALAAITAGNNDKLNNFAAWNEVIDPSRADQRAFFDDIFSVAAGASTRTALLALWKRFATKAEKLFATGTGSDAVPETLTFEGNLSTDDVSAALRS